MPRSDVTPAARSSVMIGARSAARLAARAVRILRAVAAALARLLIDLSAPHHSPIRASNWRTLRAVAPDSRASVMLSCRMATPLAQRNRHLLETVRAICLSPAVKGFVVGITVNPAARRGSYRRERLANFVILAVGLAQKKALQLEAALQSACFDGKDTRSKYHSDKVTERRKYE
jgi:hypothetical protein